MTIIVLGSPISLVTAHLHFSLTPEIILSLSRRGETQTVSTLRMRGPGTGSRGGRWQ